ncbi:MAG: alpha/beta fold hydrolase, partial [Candidatus Methylomirabilis sp.]|nr:alpha/beta fold hydrolase [Deltaproteobacteria bacterium]
MRTRLGGLALCLLLAGCPPPGGDYTKDPVLLLPGWGLSGLGSFTALKLALVDRGWPAERLFELAYTDGFDCIEFSAADLAVAVDNALAATGKEKVDLVGHSMGGIIARYYVRNLGGATKVRDVATLAGPNHGSAFPPVGFLSCAANQMMTGSPFMNALNDGDETPGAAVKWTAMIAQFDEIVLPPSSAVLAGAWNVSIPTAHLLILTHSDTYAFLHAALDGGG